MDGCGVGQEEEDEEELKDCWICAHGRGVNKHVKDGQTNLIASSLYGRKIPFPSSCDRDANSRGCNIGLSV